MYEGVEAYEVSGQVRVCGRRRRVERERIAKVEAKHVENDVRAI